jgi:hypothetical protein
VVLGRPHGEVLARTAASATTPLAGGRSSGELAPGVCGRSGHVAVPVEAQPTRPGVMTTVDA